MTAPMSNSPCSLVNPLALGYRVCSSISKGIHSKLGPTEATEILQTVMASVKFVGVKASNTTSLKGAGRYMSTWNMVEAASITDDGPVEVHVHLEYGGGNEHHR